MSDVSEEAHDIESLSPTEQARLAHHVMRRQAALSIEVAFMFILLLIGLPLLNLYAPELAAKNVLGFTLTWLILGVLFYPLTWLLSSYFVSRSDKLETECRDWRHILEEDK